MINSDGLLEFPHANAPPGTLLRKILYQGLEEHPYFGFYVDMFHQGRTVGFSRSEIMDQWTDQPLISFRFATCYPLIANNPLLTHSQAIHVSRDPWFPTDMEKLERRVKEWKAAGDKVLMFTTNRSALGREIDEWGLLFGRDYVPIHADTDSRFEVVFDVQKQLLFVQLADAKLLQIYQGFRK